MPDFRIESALAEEGYALVAGVDEAGRGPLAGPVVAAAVILPAQLPDDLTLDDSKRLTARQREAAYGMIRRVARAYCTVAVGAARIDRINILCATLEGMASAVQRLRVQPQFVLVDGNQLPPLALPCRAVVKGDRTCNSIAAASILAKVARDRIMTAYGGRYPGWGFEGHKGYGTAAHREAIGRLGPSPIHRRSFRGCEGP